MTKIISLKQHYVPQFYLRNFGEILSVVDRTDESKFKTLVKNIGMEKNFYGGEISGAPSLEKALSNLEKKFAAAIREIIEKKRLS